LIRHLADYPSTQSLVFIDFLIFHKPANDTLTAWILPG
jgi:hypothetical protein